MKDGCLQADHYWGFFVSFSSWCVSLNQVIENYIRVPLDIVGFVCLCPKKTADGTMKICPNLIKCFTDGGFVGFIQPGLHLITL